MNSIKKGKRGEREIVHLLNQMTGAEWKRVPCSGALFTSYGSMQFKGDVYSDDEKFKDLVVEVKNQSGVVGLHHFAQENSDLSKWINQLRNEAGKNRGVLFFKSSGKWCWLALNIRSDDEFYLKLISFSRTYLTNLGVI